MPDASADRPVDLMKALEDSLAAAKEQLSSTHAYFKAQGFESCPECGLWLGTPKWAEGMRRPETRDKP